MDTIITLLIILIIMCFVGFGTQAVVNEFHFRSVKKAAPPDRFTRLMIFFFWFVYWLILVLPKGKKNEE